MVLNWYTAADVIMLRTLMLRENVTNAVVIVVVIRLQRPQNMLDYNLKP